MTPVRALLVLALDVLAVLGIALWLRHAGDPLGGGILWGSVAGIVTAASAIGGAWWAEAAGMQPNQALAVVVVGMLGRMFFLGAWAILAVKAGGADPLGFLVGFAAIYVIGQILEVWMLLRLKGRRAG